MKRPTKLAFLIAVAFLPAWPAEAAVQTVSIVDNGYSLATKPAALNDTVKWTNTGFNPHTTTGDSPLNFWASGSVTVPNLSHNATFTSPVFYAAGTYPYHCKVHTFMHGKIQVPLKLSAAGRNITLTLASKTGGSTHKYIVQRKVGTGYSKIKETTAMTYVFNAPAAGTYTFRSALQKNSSTATEPFFSLPASIKVT